MKKRIANLPKKSLVNLLKHILKLGKEMDFSIKLQKDYLQGTWNIKEDKESHETPNE